MKIGLGEETCVIWSYGRCMHFTLSVKEKATYKLDEKRELIFYYIALH